MSCDFVLLPNGRYWCQRPGCDPGQRRTRPRLSLRQCRADQPTLKARRRCGSGQRRARRNGWGPGSLLLKAFTAGGVPHCEACCELAGRMDRWGKQGCQQRLAQIVDEIMPRARAWVTENRPVVHRLLSIACLETMALRLAIRRKVQSAIDATPDKPPKRVPRRRHRRAVRTDPIRSPANPLWRTEPNYRRLGESLLARTEVIVKSLLRHSAVLGLVESIRQFYPELPIRIVDDSPIAETHNEYVDKVRATPFVSWHQMMFDSGVTAGRNLAVKFSSAEFIVLCDDDMVFTPRTDLSALLIGLHETGADIFGGLSRRKGAEVARNWCGRISIVDGVLRMAPLRGEYETVAGIRFRWSDLTYNFFAARRAFLIQHPWDEQWKTCEEHLDSFLMWWSVGAKIAFTVDSVCDETTIANNGEYLRLRNRRPDESQLHEKWGITKRETIAETRFPGA